MIVFGATLSGEVVEWLTVHAEMKPAFLKALARVRAGVDLGEAVPDPSERYLLRMFRFGKGCVAVFSVDTAARRVRVLRCAEVRERPG